MTTTLTWTKPDFRHVAEAPHGTYTAVRSAGRFYLGYTPKGTPATEDIGKGTLAKCKEIAEEHHAARSLERRVEAQLPPGVTLDDVVLSKFVPDGMAEGGPATAQITIEPVPASALPCPAEVEEMLAGDPRFLPPCPRGWDSLSTPPDEMAQYDDPCEEADQQLVRGPTPASDRTQDNALTVESLADGLACQLSRRPDAPGAAPGVFRRLGKGVARMVRRALHRRGRADLAALPRA